MKKWNGLSIPVVILSLIVGLLVFFGGQFIYNKYNYVNPLKNVIENKDYVQQYNIEKEDQNLNITVQFKDTAENLDFIEMYQDLSLNIENVLPKKQFAIEIKDNPDQDLKQIWRKSQFAVEEAIMCGNFTEMAAQIEKLAAENKIQADVYVDHNSIYVQFKKNDGHNLFKVVNRQNFMVTGQVADVGGVVGVERN